MTAATTTTGGTMEWTASIVVKTERPLTEDTLISAAEIGGVATGHIGGHDLELTFTVVAPTVGQAVKDAEFAGITYGKVVGVEIITTEEADRRLAEPAFPALAGVREVAELLGVSRQRASELQTRPGFPAPVAVIASGPVWRLGDLSTFAESWERKPGRPRKVS